MNNEPTLQHLIPVGDVAQIYSVSERTIWRMAKAGKIPAPVQLGTRVTRWRSDELFEHIDQLLPASSPPSFEGAVQDMNFNHFEIESTEDASFFGHPYHSNSDQGE